jgi:hypothetical protein
MEDEKNIDEPESVLCMEGLELPENVCEGILEESGNIFECSPFLSHVSRLSCGLNEFTKVTIGFLSKGSIKNIIIRVAGEL